MGISLSEAIWRGDQNMAWFMEVCDFLRGNSYEGFDRLIQLFPGAPYIMSRYISKKIDLSDVETRIFEHSPTQAWLLDILPPLIPIWREESAEGYLKPLMENVESLRESYSLDIDYIQLRITLIELGEDYCKIL